MKSNPFKCGKTITFSLMKNLFLKIKSELSKGRLSRLTIPFHLPTWIATSLAKSCGSCASLFTAFNLLPSLHNFRPNLAASLDKPHYPLRSPLLTTHLDLYIHLSGFSLFELHSTIEKDLSLVRLLTSCCHFPFLSPSPSCLHSSWSFRIPLLCLIFVVAAQPFWLIEDEASNW